MGNLWMILAGVAVLSLGTWLMRFGGAMLGNRLALTERTQAMLADAATTLLFAVALASTFYQGIDFAGAARVAGVAVAVLLAWRKTPLIVVIVVAAAVTAGLRWLGVP